MRDILQALRAAAGMLARAGVPDPAVDAALLLSHITGRAPLELRALGGALTTAQEEAYDVLLARRAAREPLQYIVGTVDFMGASLRAAPGALIPRMDTEILCERAFARMRPNARALDLCTGTGALAVAIKLRFPTASVQAGDISPEALAIARENARLNKAKVDFCEGDLLAPFQGQTFDVIVSNPPYIPLDALTDLQPEVQFEPRLALAGGADGLDFYRRIARDAPQCLAPGGWLLLEIGCDQAQAVRALLAPRFADIAVSPDLRGLDRVVEARKAL